MSSESASSGLPARTRGSLNAGFRSFTWTSLVAVVDEHPREVLHLEAVDDVAAGRRLGIQADVLQLADEEIDAGGLRPVEQERLAERELVVRRAAALLRRDREGFAAAEEVRRLERQLAEEPVGTATRPRRR